MVFPSTGAHHRRPARREGRGRLRPVRRLHGLRLRDRAGARHGRGRPRQACARRRRRRALEDRRLGRPQHVRPLRRRRGRGRARARATRAASSASSSAPTARAARSSTCRPAARARRRRPRRSPRAQHFVKMNGREVFKFATRVLVESAEKVLDECGVAVDDVDVYVPHQANVRIIDHARRKLGIPEERSSSTSTGTATRLRARSRSRSPMRRPTGGLQRENWC